MKSKGLSDNSLNRLAKIAKDYLPGGLADGMGDDEFDSEQLQKGIEVEHEHTDDDAIAKEISKDHLEEFPKYYDALDKMEEELKKKKSRYFRNKAFLKNSWSSGPSTEEIIEENPATFRNTEPTPTDDLPNVSPEEEGTETLTNRKPQDF